VATNAQIAPSLGRNLASGVNGTVVIDLIAPYTQFEDRINQLDFRLTRVFKINRARLEGMVDLYNALNASPILSMNTRYGASWLRPIQGARRPDRKVRRAVHVLTAAAKGESA